MNKRPMTSEIIGKAHKLVEHLVSPGSWGHYKLDELAPVWADQVRAAIKIHAGNIDDVPSIPLDWFKGSLLHLPFPVVVVEFACKVLRSALAAPSNVVMLALLREVDNQIHVTFFFDLGKEHWTVSGGAVVYATSNQGVMFRPVSHTGAKLSEPTMEDVAEYLRNVMDVLGALACSNVALVDHAPPDALNRKRSKAGKVPLFTYKTLHIVTDRDRTKRTARENDAEARQSPRLHLRRGHIRRLDESRMVWVQPAMVGDADRGKVVNAYAVTRKGGNGH